MRFRTTIDLHLAPLVCFLALSSHAPTAASEGITLSWEKNMLSIRAAGLPGGQVEVWYLEAFCRSRSTRRDWAKTVIPHQTEKLQGSGSKLLKLRSKVEGGVEVMHEIRAGEDEVDFLLTARNDGPEHVDVAWAQPCMRVGGFTGRRQEDYIEKCFIFVDGKLTTLEKTRRTEEAIYRGGQVYVPSGVDREDVNPRPLSPDIPSQDLIGCFSASGERILAMAWEPCQELFQGVIVCIHADFRLGGLKPGEIKTAHGKIYIVENDEKKLLARYRRDFPEKGAARASASKKDTLGEEGWRLDLFDPITDKEEEEEKRFYSEVLEAWGQGNGLQGLLLATKELALHPARNELHLLRSASALVELQSASAPLAALQGELQDSGAEGSDDDGEEVTLEALSFAMEEFERAFPDLPSRPTPWTGLYHPHAQRSLAGSLVSFWSHGLRPLLRLRGLSFGRLDVFEALEDQSPSLVDLLLKAQILAARGEAEKAKALLSVDGSALTAPESWARWKPRIAALSAICAQLPPEESRRKEAFETWARETRAAIPEIGRAMISLPPRALAVLGDREKAKPAKPAASPDGRRLAGMFLERRAKPSASRGRALSKEEKETVEAIHQATLRMRDFRADVLRRVEAGDTSVILSGDLSRDGELRFIEGRKRKVSFGRLLSPAASKEKKLSIPCGEGYWLTLSPE